MSKPIKIIPELIDPSGYEAIEAAVTALEALRKATSSFGRQVTGIEKFSNSLLALKQVAKDLGDESKNTNLFDPKGVQIIVQTESAVKGVTRAYKENKEAVEGQRKVVEVAMNSVAGYEKVLKNLIANYKAVDLSTADAGKQQQQFLTQIKSVRGMIEEQTVSLRKTSGAMQAAQGSYNALSAELNQLRKELRAMPEGMNENSAAAFAMKKRISELDEQLKKFDRELGQNFREVGGYARGIIEAKEALERKKAELTKQSTALMVYGKNLQKGSAELDRWQKELDQTERELKQVNIQLNAFQQNNTSTVINNLGTSFKSLFLGIVGGGVVLGILDRIVGLGPKIIDLTSQFQKFKAVLSTSLGSEGAAERAFTRIQKFAAETPYSVEQITESFVKLSGRGVQPTTEQLTNMGDVAAATGKDMEQLTEAILDVNNTERWNELGIKVKTNGDKISGTFRGMTVEAERTEVGALKMIETFGKMEGVAGTMEKVSATVGGALSNLNDNWNTFLANIGEKSSGIIKFATDDLNGFLSVMNKLMTGQYTVAGKEFKETFDLISEGIDGLKSADEAVTKLQALQIGARYLKGELQDMRSQLANAEDLLSRPFQNSGKSTIELRLEIKKLTDQIELTQAQYDAYAKAIAAVNDKQKQLADTTKKTVPEQLGTLERLQKNIDELVLARKKDVDLTDAEGQAYARRIKRYQDEIEKLTKLREAIKTVDASTLKPITGGGLDKDAAAELTDIDFKKEEKRFKNLTEIRRKSIVEEGMARKATSEEIDREIEMNEIAHLLAMLNLYKQYGKDTTDIEEELLRRRLESYKKDEKEFEKTEKNKTKLSKDETLKRVEFGIEQAYVFGNASFDVASGLRERDLQDLEAKKQAELDKLEESANESMRISSQDQEVQAKLRDDYEAARAQKEEQYRKREAAIKTRQAKADKAQTLFNIALNTGMAVTSVLSTGGGTRYADFGISAGILTALVIAQGLAQAAAVIAKPIPQFFRGTSYAPEGLALVDERGPEIIERKGKMYLGQDEGPRLTYLERGDKVYTAEKTRNILAEAEATQAMESFETGSRQLRKAEHNKNVYMASLQVTKDPELLREIKMLRKAYENQPQFHSNITKDGFETLIKKASNITRYRDNIFPNGNL